MAVICPGDAVEVRLSLRAAIEHSGPIYIRLGKKNEPTVHQAEPRFQIGKAITVREGSDACLLSVGNMLPVAMEAAVVLAARGISARVVSFHTVKPLDEELLGEVFEDFPVVAAIEEHSCIGGFSSSIAEWMADRQAVRGRLVRIATEDRFMHSPGNRLDSHRTLGLTPESIAERVRMRLF
jgi:transketolase